MLHGESSVFGSIMPHVPVSACFIAVKIAPPVCVKPWFHVKTRNPAIAEGPRDAGVPVEIW